MNSLNASNVVAAEAASVSTTTIIFSLIFAVVEIIALWKIFKKAGQPGWAAIIPIYDVYILLKIVDLEWWYMLLMLIPFVNIYVVFKTSIRLAHKFGKSTLFGVLSVFFSFICYLILGFGDAKYKGAKK